jgi:hypothetical protein
MRHKVTTELRYPGLWRGCVGAWDPGLGPSGLTLRDNGPVRNHATLSNMPAATAWALNYGKIALDFSVASTAFAAAGKVSLPSGGEPRTLCAWVRLQSSPSGVNGSIIDMTRPSGQGFIFQCSGTDGSNNYAFTDGVNGGNNLAWPGGFEPLNVWTFRAITLQNNVYSLYSAAWGSYLTLRSSGTFAVSINTNTDGVYIGARKGFATTPALMTDLRIYNRVLSAQELRLLANRPGIAYELAPRRRSSVQVAGGFKAAWIPRRSLIVGGGIN